MAKPYQLGHRPVTKRWDPEDVDSEKEDKKLLLLIIGLIIILIIISLGISWLKGL